VDTIEFEQFTRQLVDRLSADPEVLGLIALGSTADASYRDTRSDHDFWLIVTPTAASRYRKQL
jgi:predicted RNA polymerase sigma factor